jgi:ribosomal protein S18 acetylase RimI-like enzyme
MDETDLVIAIREFNREEDEPYIYASWRNASYYSALDRPKQDPKAYFKAKTREIKDLLDQAHVRIACIQETPIVIVGYAVSIGDHLEMIFVKPDYRRKGIGKMLCPKWVRTYTDKLTKIGKLIADKNCLTLTGEPGGNELSGSHKEIQSIKTRRFYL